MQKVELGEVYLWVWQQGGSLLMEATAKYYKQQIIKPELSEVCYSGGHAWLKGAQVAKWGRIPDVTAWSQDPRVARTGDA